MRYFRCHCCKNVSSYQELKTGEAKDYKRKNSNKGCGFVLLIFGLILFFVFLGILPIMAFTIPFIAMGLFLIFGKCKMKTKCPICGKINEVPIR